jgi:hypothetical protein
MSNNSSEQTNNSKYKLESAQENQNEVGNAESDPETSSPTDKVREEAFEESETEDKSKEPA